MTDIVHDAVSLAQYVHAPDLPVLLAVGALVICVVYVVAPPSLAVRDRSQEGRVVDYSF